MTAECRFLYGRPDSGMLHRGNRTRPFRLEVKKSLDVSAVCTQSWSVKTKEPTEIRTRDGRFKVFSANHYTMGSKLYAVTAGSQDQNKIGLLSYLLYGEIWCHFTSDPTTMSPAGFEPAPPKRTDLKSVALDHSAKGT